MSALSGNRSHGKIDALPDKDRQEVDAMLLSGETYERISDHLQEKGHDIGYSSVGRYGRKYLNRFESVRVAQQYAKLLAEDSVDRPPTEMHEANNILISQIIMETLVNASEMEVKDVQKAANAIAALQRAQVSNEKLKSSVRKESGAVHTAMDLLKEKIFREISESHPEIARVLIQLASETEAEIERLDKK